MVTFDSNAPMRQPQFSRQLAAPRQLGKPTLYNDAFRQDAFHSQQQAPAQPHFAMNRPVARTAGVIALLLALAGCSSNSSNAETSPTSDTQMTSVEPSSLDPERLDQAGTRLTQIANGSISNVQKPQQLPSRDENYNPAEVFRFTADGGQTVQLMYLAGKNGSPDEYVLDDGGLTTVLQQPTIPGETALCRAGVLPGDSTHRFLTDTPAKVPFAELSAVACQLHLTELLSKLQAA